MRTFLLPTALVLALATACSAGTPPVDSPGSAPTSGPAGSGAGSPSASADAVLRINTTGIAGGPGISVQEALDSELDEALLVNGALFIDENGDAVLCEALAESFPPQCGGARIAVEGLNLETLDAATLQEEGDVRWVEQVQLLGTVER